MLQKVTDWQVDYPQDNFSFMPASAAEPSEDADILKGVECLEQDDDDEAYPEVNMSEVFGLLTQ